jgi:hypothetical protein
MHGGSPLSEAGSQLPFPLRSDLGNLADRHGAGVPARGPTYLSAHGIRSVDESSTALLALDNSSDPTVVQTSLSGDLAQR